MSPMGKSILVVEDELDLLEYLREILSSQRYSVHTASNGARARKLFFKIEPDVVLLDLNLPDIDGQSLLSEFKAEKGMSQIIILTAENEPTSIARNLQNGADDYMVKPFTADELFARIHARLRDQKTQSPVLKIHDITINTEAVEVKKGNKLIELTHTEFELLRYLVENKNKVLTREMILSRIWSSDPNIETRVVDVYIGYLRKKLEVGGGKLIYSKRGYGYVIRDDN